jgi:hypothetical protein
MIDLEELVWVELAKPDDFLKVKETLSRIGVASNKSKTLYQSCHILSKFNRTRYAIVHFKQLFALDGKHTDFTDEDKERLYTIANFLAECGLVKLVDPKKTDFPTMNLANIKIIKFKDKSEWNLVTKYSIGNKEKPPTREVRQKWD